MTLDDGPRGPLPELPLLEGPGVRRALRRGTHDPLVVRSVDARAAS